MRFTYSPKADALAIELDSKAKSVRTVPLTGDINIDYDAKGRLITIEILNASAYYTEAELARLGSPDELLTLAEAGAEAGLSPTTLRVQIRNGRLEALKRGRDLLVHRAALWFYLDNRGRQDTPSDEMLRQMRTQGGKAAARATGKKPLRKAV